MVRRVVDILSIGSGAVNAYRQALSTTSNNIANVNSPGYSKRALQISESFPVQEGIFSFGSGAQAEAVARAYDEFIERSLRDATGDLSVNEPVIQYANRVIDLMATESGSLSNAIDNFFNAAQLLSSQPSSLTYRNEFLNSAEVVASRFNDISAQVDRVAEDAEAEFRAAVDELNALSAQLLVVNKQLNRKTSVDQQPPGLLDQRDAILRDMASLTKIGVTESPSGQVSVNFGGSGRGFEFVTPTEVKKVAIFSSQEKSALDLRLVLDPFNSNRPLPNNPGGSLGGHLAFNAEVMRPVRVGLDHLASTFAKQINGVHELGQDQYGDPGESLFRVKTTFSPSFETANGAISASLSISDPAEAGTEALELIYRERVNAWDVINVVTRDRIGTIPLEGGEVDGIQFSISGEPLNGDVIIFTPEYRPAESFELLISDPKKLAVAASMQSRPDTDNAVTMDTSLIFRQPEDPRAPIFDRGFIIGSSDDGTYRQDLTLNAGGRGPSLQIQRDASNVNVEFDVEYDAEQHFHVFTSEGVHLAGTETLTLAQANAMIASDTGFGDGAYSASYLNKSGSEAFLGTTIKFGIDVPVTTERVVNVDPETGSVSESSRLVGPALVSKPIVPTSNNTGSNETLIGSGDLNFKYQFADASHVNADVDGLVTETFALGELTLASNGQLSARTLAEYFNAEFDAQGISDLSASAVTRVVASDIDLDRSLSINGTEITLYSTMDLSDAIAAINGASATTNVKAEWFGESGIVLTNTSGYEGDNIMLGAPAVLDQISALGLVPGTYSGTYELSVTGVDSTTNRPSIESFGFELSASGTPSDLGRLGLKTQLLIDGNSPDDLAVFVTGSGTLDTTINIDPKERSDARKYPARPFSVDFISDSIYTITDLETNTVVTTRLYDGNQTITYQDVTLKLGSTPSNGDSFFIEKNLNGPGNNENFLTLIELGKQPIIKGQTFVEAYRDLVSGVGSRSRLAQLNEEAMQVVKDQAEATREAAVGVNLDEEAADLIRFQQAYQAAAQVIQISQRMFDTLIQAG